MSKKLVLKQTSGWGGPLAIPIDTNKKILCMTGNGIHPLARKISEVTGVPVIDGFQDGVADDEVLLAVINCGGTLRCGIYPKKGIYTLNLNNIGPSGPLEQFITKENYISGVTAETIEVDEAAISNSNLSKTETAANVAEPEKPKTVSRQNMEKDNWFISLVGNMGMALGKGISLAYESAKDAVNTVLKSVLPFMVFISVLVTLIMASGIGNAMANAIKPIAGTLVGLIIISVICGIPFLSPLLGPGAAIAQVIGVLLGTQIGEGIIPAQYALPALFAINVQVGADFVPVGLSMQEAKPDTIKYGTPAFLLSRCLTGPLAVIVAFLFSIGMY